MENLIEELQTIRAVRGSSRWPSPWLIAAILLAGTLVALFIFIKRKKICKFRLRAGNVDDEVLLERMPKMSVEKSSQVASDPADEPFVFVDTSNWKHRPDVPELPDQQNNDRRSSPERKNPSSVVSRTLTSGSPLKINCGSPRHHRYSRH